jgi:hypothetical protein
MREQETGKASTPRENRNHDGLLNFIRILRESGRAAITIERA